MTTIRGVSSIISQIENMHFGPDEVPKPTENINEELKKNEIPSYEIPSEEQKKDFQVDTELSKNNKDEVFEIVKQEYNSEKKKLGNIEKIDTEGMKQAFAWMDVNPDYISKNNVMSEKVDLADENIIVNKKGGAIATISRTLDINLDYVVQPKKIIHQYEIQCHNLPRGYDIPKIKLSVSINKIALVLFDGTDLTTSDGKVYYKRNIGSFVELSIQNIGLVINHFSE